MANCKQCNEVFEAKRSTAMFCSTKCKLAYHRGKISVSDDTVKDSVSLPHFPPPNYRYWTPNQCIEWLKENRPDLVGDTSRPGDVDYNGVYMK